MHYNKHILTGLILILLLVSSTFLLFKTSHPTPSENSKKIQIVTSFYPLYFFTSEIVGDKASTLNITPAGAEPHDYEPTAQDIAKIENSNMLILNGGKLEAWADKIKSNIKPEQTKIITVGEALITQQTTEENETVADPHIWLSPKLAKQMVSKIEAELALIDPANAASYKSNADKLIEKLAALDAKYTAGLSECKKKDFITSHAAFGYLATSYNINQVPIAGLSPEEEPSSKELTRIAQFAKDNHVEYIFFESLISPKLSQTIASEIGAQTLVLNPIEGLTEEDMHSGKNYISEMENNLANLKIALECTQ